MSDLKTLQFKEPQEYKPGDVLILYENIQERIKEVASEIAPKYKGKKLLIVGVLKGAFKMTGDLALELHAQGLIDLEISFITMKSYLTDTRADYEPRIIQDMDINPDKRHVLLLDDVLDTGKSLQEVHRLVKDRGAISTESFVLLDKPARRKVDYKADYVGFTIPNVWVQGCGMDTGELGRGEPNIIVGPYKY